MILDRGLSEMITTKFGPNFLYEIQDDEGNIKKCWARKNITDVMKLFKFGTRVKIEFVASHPSKKGANFKEIKVFGNSSVMNEEWVESQGNTTEDVPEVDIEDLAGDEPFPSKK